MKQKKLHNKSGTTLIECVLALAVFTGVSVMIAMMLSTASLLQRTGTDLEQAVNMAGDEAELAITTPVAVNEGTAGELIFVEGEDGSGGEVARASVRFIEHTAEVKDAIGVIKGDVTVWRMGIPAAPPVGP